LAIAESSTELKSAGLSPDEGLGQSHHGSDSNRPNEESLDSDGPAAFSGGGADVKKRTIMITNPSVDVLSEDLGILINGHDCEETWSVRQRLSTMHEESGTVTCLTLDLYWNCY